MKDTTDLQNIRLLLDRYYNGDASAEDMMELKRFFSSATEVPSDLEPDKAIFGMMAATDLSDGETEVPEGLEQTLHGIAITPERRGYRFPAIAAAAAAIILLATCAIYILKPSPTVTPPVIAEATVEPTPRPMNTEETDTAPAPEHVPPVPHTPHRAHVTDKTASPYIEVTDSAEAARITVDALRRMRHTMNMAMNTTEEITGKNIENISKVKQIIERIQ